MPPESRREPSRDSPRAPAGDPAGSSRNARAVPTPCHLKAKISRLAGAFESRMRLSIAQSKG